MFTLRQWKDLDPTTIRAVQHNDIYWLFARPPEQGGSGTPGQTYKAYALDMKANGFGVVEMPFHASAVHVDPVTDTMYLVLDDINEPDDPSLPIPPTTPAGIAAGNVISAFRRRQHEHLMTYRWKGQAVAAAGADVHDHGRVRADDYDNILLRVYGDGVQVDEVVVTGEEEFTLAETDAYRKLEIEVLGTSTIRGSNSRKTCGSWVDGGTLGSPAIGNVRALEVREVNGILAAARQRIEALERAISLLQSTTAGPNAANDIQTLKGSAGAVASGGELFELGQRQRVADADLSRLVCGAGGVRRLR